MGFRHVAWCVALLLAACTADVEPSPVDGALDAPDGWVGDAESEAHASDVPDPETVIQEVLVPDPHPGPPEPCVVFTPDAADPSAALFDPTCVVDVNIEMSPQDWEELRHQTRSFVDIIRDDCLAAPAPSVFTWFEADVTVSGQRVEGVGIRKKGFLGSLSVDKPALKIRFDKFVDDQHLATLTRLTLNNLNQDPSLINTCLAYAVMAQAGLTAPRCNFARVFVNQVDLGIYAHVDSIKKPFLAQRFSSDEGNLYEATISDFRPLFRGTWEKKTNKQEDDWSDLDAAVAALEVPDEELLASAEAVFDLDAFFTFWATEVLIGHWDGYAGNLNNTYLYADPTDGLFHFIPWGVDSAFLDPQSIVENNYGGALPHSVYAFGHLAYRLYAHPEGRSTYTSRLIELLETAWDGPALIEEIDRMELLLAPHLSLSDHEALALQLDGKRGWIANRKQQLEMELFGFKHPDWNYPPRGTICWPEAGSISGTFDTEWGTSGWNYLQQVGTIEHDVPFMGSVGNIAANARLGTGWSEGQAVIELIASEEGGMNIFVVIYGPPDLVAPDTSIPIDWKSFGGVIGRAQFLNLEFELIGVMLDGVLSFEVASTYLGERVTGSFSADVIAPP